MIQPDYEQKKRKCWVEFCKDNGINQEVNISIFDAFNQIFDRAYALSKQKETISQEEIQKLAKEFAELKTVKQAGSSVERDRKALLMTQFFNFSMERFALGKQEKDADTVIQGWVARDDGER